MLPLVYSTKEVARTGLGWRRMGHNVCYYQNHIKRRTGYYYTASFQVTARQPATSHHHHLHSTSTSTSTSASTSSPSFQIRFLHADDVCYLAYCHPYTMSDLGAYLKGLEDDPKTRKRFRRRPLCETLSGCSPVSAPRKWRCDTTATERYDAGSFASHRSASAARSLKVFSNSVTSAG